ncbi:hypothetical protein MLD38_040186 [Melastoma candidum]|uniref:Uncharacterized protein n=1 Tax=Melastoma candidum TaxID=119954 RepID=A0ACB9L5M4_9MYRT|nr:hypothetical protein MLD38_040186 [Melastoma candidum]
MTARMAAFLATVVLVLVSCAGTVAGAFPTSLTLERAFPVEGSKRLELRKMMARDRARHGRMLSSSEVVDFSVEGSYDPFTVGLYYTKVQLGNPSRDFYVQIDTGSDVLWVNCDSCRGCPGKSGLPIPINPFNPSSSSSASTVSCSSQICMDGLMSSDSTCSGSGCSFSFQYGDGSGVSGYYVSDKIHFDTIPGGDSQYANSSASIVFGCGMTVTGELTKSDRAVSGIFGLGQRSMSVVSQLASQGVTPNIFSHCLRGDGKGGGILVLGEIVEPNIVYSPLIPSQPHYNLNLQSISVGGQKLAIDSTVFSTSNSQGTIIDSGTTLAYFAEAAYNPFVTAITESVSGSARVFSAQGTQCYMITSSVTEAFPQVSLNFEGATMTLSPQDYLLQQDAVEGSQVWCMGISKIPGQDMTILGDLVLKDKIIIYDLANQRIGWAKYDCSKSVNVSAPVNTGRNDFVYIGQPGYNNSGLPEQELNQLTGDDEPQFDAVDEPQISLPSLPPPSIYPRWDQGLHHDRWSPPNFQQHLGMQDWDIINDLRVDMARFQQRMNNMQRMLEDCMDMQLELQRSIRQEVSAALNRSALSQGACDTGCREQESNWGNVRKGLCCMCSENDIDSLLYRCGHMCTCSKCADGLVGSQGRCPMCRAPVVEAIRAYFIL